MNNDNKKVLPILFAVTFLVMAGFGIIITCVALLRRRGWCITYTARNANGSINPLTQLIFAPMRGTNFRSNWP